MDQPILIFILFAVVFTGLIAAVIVGHRKEQARRAAYAAFADARGLEYSLRSSRRGPSEIQFRDRDRDITLVITRRRTRKTSQGRSVQGGTTALQMSEPRLQGGLVLYAPALPKEFDGVADALMGAFDNKVAKFLIGKAFGEDIAAHLGEMIEQPVPDGVALTILGNADPDPVFDPAAAQRALDAAPKGGKGDRATMILVSDTGTRIRMGRELLEIAEIETLLDTAQALATELPR